MGKIWQKASNLLKRKPSARTISDQSEDRISRRKFLKKTAVTVAALATAGSGLGWLLRRKRKSSAKPPVIRLLPQIPPGKIARNAGEKLGFAIKTIFDLDEKMYESLSGKELNVFIVTDIEREAQQLGLSNFLLKDQKDLKAFTAFLEDKKGKIISVFFDAKVFQNHASAFGIVAHEFFNASRIEERYGGQYTRNKRIFSEREAFAYSTGMLQKLANECKKQLAITPNNKETQVLLQQTIQEIVKEKISLESWKKTPLEREP